MAGRPKRNRNGEQEPLPKGLDPTSVFGALLQGLEQIGNNYGEFRALHPDKYDGTGEAWQAEQWLREMDRIFETMECSEADKRRLAISQLTFAAADWWEIEKAILGDEGTRRMT